MRLFDRIIQGAQIRVTSQDREKDSDEIKKVLLGSPKFVVDNVAEYYSTHEKEYWIFHEDFPYPRPPHELMWVEYEVPRTFYSKEKGVTEAPRPKELRLYFGAIVTEDEGYISIFGHYWTVYTPTENLRLYKGKVNCKFKIDPETGKLTDVRVPQEYYTDQKLSEDDISNMMYALHPVLMALSFMNCKNSEIVEVEVPPKLQKARVRRGKKPLSDFRVINLLPMGEKNVVRRTRKVYHYGENLSEVSIKISRGGSYAFYGPKYGKGLLFGKYEGMFWRSPVVGDTVPKYKLKVKETQEVK